MLGDKPAGARGGPLGEEHPFGLRGVGLGEDGEFVGQALQDLCGVWGLGLRGGGLGVRGGGSGFRVSGLGLRVLKVKGSGFTS